MSPAARRWLVLAAIVLAVGGVAAWRWLRPDAIEVEVATVAEGRVEQTATNSRAGTVEARRRARLSPDTGGRVLALPHRRGEAVAAGAILLELDATLERGEVDLRSRQLESAKADADRACLAGQRAARELERNRRLAAEELVPIDALDHFDSAAREAAAACTAAQANRASAGAALELTRRALDKRTLRAPFAGLIADLSTELGEWITPSPPGVPIPPVIDLLDPESIYLSLPMDEVDAGRLRAGQTARATVDSRPGEHFAGRLIRVAPYVLDVEAQNRTVEIEVELEPQVPGLLPGTSADVEIVLDARDGVLRAPAASVMTQDRVLVVAGETLVERKIETGLRNWDFVEILAGLAAGDRVVTSLDRPGVRAGARVVTGDGDRSTRP
jgi:HlyD family secretion protein